MKSHFLNHVTLSVAKGLPPCGRGFFAPSGLRMTYRIYPELTLKSQIIRAVTSISLNIVEGSTGQSNPEQSRFLGMAIRSLIETVACQRIITRRKYANDKDFMEQLDLKAQELAKRPHTFRRSLTKSNKSVGEEQAPYDTDEI